MPKANAVFEAVVKLSPVPSKYPEPYVATLLDRVNGWAGETAAVPLGVIVYAFVELSIKRLDWQVSNDVFVIAANGVVDGVKLDV